MKRVVGYVRDIPGGAPVASIPVTIYDKFTGAAVPVGGMQGGTANPISTDGDGRFEWLCELSPGPIRAEADLAGTEVKVRDGEEIMQAGSFFLSDLGELFLAFSTGVLDDVLDEFSATPAGGTREVTLGTGRAFMIGLPFGLDTTRSFTFDANASMANRYDLIVMQQWISGDREGRQALAVVKGTVNETEPTINADPEILEVALWRAQIANGASVVTVVDKRIYAGMSTIGPVIQAALDLKAPKDAPIFTGSALFSGGATITGALVVGGALTAGSITTAGAVSIPDAAISQAKVSGLVAALAAKAGLAAPAFTGTVTADGLILSGGAEIDGAINHDGTTVGFYGSAPVTQGPNLTNRSTAVISTTTWGSGEAAVLESLRTAFNELATYLASRGDIAGS